MRTVESNLLDYLRLLVRRRRLIIQGVLVCTIIAGITSFLLPKKYRAEAVILPLAGKATSAAALASSMGGGLGGLLDIGGNNSQTNQLMVLLKSRSLSERVIERLELIPTLGKGKSIPMQVAVSKLSEQIEIGEDKKQQTVTVAAKAGSPEMAVSIVNAYLGELKAFIQASAFTQAKHYRMYLEEQVANNKRGFLETGNELNSFYKEGRISNVESKVIVDDPDIPDDVNTEETRKALSKLAAVDPNGDFANDSSPTVSVTNVTNKPKSSLKKVPQQVYLQYLTLRHEILAKMSAMTAQQLELAKMEEAKDELKFQVIDPAIPPLSKCWPKRTEMVLTTFLASFLFLCLGVIVHDRAELTRSKT